MQFYFFVGKGKTRVGGSVNHGIKNSSPKVDPARLILLNMMLYEVNFPVADS